MAFGGLWQRSWAFLFGLLAPVLAIVAVYQIVQLWPVVTASDAAAAQAVELGLGLTWTLTPEQGLLALAAGGGLLGGLLYTMGLYSRRRSRGHFNHQDANWYWARCIIGAGLGLTVHLLIRAGLFVLGGQSTDELPDAFGVLGVSIVVGLFTDRVLTALRNVAGNFFATQEELAEEQPVTVPRVSPAELAKGVTGQHLTVVVDNGGQPLAVVVDGLAQSLHSTPATPDTYQVPVDDAHVTRDAVVLEIALPDGSTWRRAIVLAEQPPAA